MSRCVALVAVMVIIFSQVGDSCAATPAELRKAANKGDLQAALHLGMLYRDGRGVDANPREALRWYRVAADGGLAAGLDNVGFMYFRGLGVSQDYFVAAGYFRSAAAKGDAQGGFNLGKCYFSGHGVEQDYAQAIKAWTRAAKLGSQHAAYRLALLYASGESVERDLDRARNLAEPLARSGYPDALLLMGELDYQAGQVEKARQHWQQAAKRGSRRAADCLELAKWRGQPNVPGKHVLIPVQHLYQGWNNCGATSIGMFCRHMGTQPTPYQIKRMCPRSPIGTGTDWQDLMKACEQLGHDVELQTFAHTAKGFKQGTKALREHLDAGRAVVIDFTVKVMEDGVEQSYGHTLMLVGYHLGNDQYVLKNPNQPAPGLELLTAAELEQAWYSRGYSRLARGKAARPIIVQKRDES